MLVAFLFTESNATVCTKDVCTCYRSKLSLGYSIFKLVYFQTRSFCLELGPKHSLMLTLIRPEQKFLSLRLALMNVKDSSCISKQ